MGWLYRREKLRHETPVQYFTRHFTGQGETQDSTVLDAAAVGGAVYAAIRNTDRRTGKSYVFCAVILFKNNDRDGFGYKSMDEGMGPCAIDCPDRIMRLLSPVEGLPDPGYAADWRARVATAKAARRSETGRVGKLSPGDRVRLPVPARFQKSGIIADQFVVVEIQNRTPILTPATHPQFRCRLQRATLATATIER